MAEGETKRYLAVVILRPDTEREELPRRQAALASVLKSLATGEIEMAFNSQDTKTLGILFKSAAGTWKISDALDRLTLNGDTFLVMEAGGFIANKGLGRAATWLQRQ